MSLNRDYLIAIREREAHQSIREENANYLNQVLYLRDILPQKNQNDNKSKSRTGNRNLG